MWVCNYTSAPIALEKLGIVLQPGPNFLEARKAREVLKQMGAEEQAEQVALVKSLEEVEWERVAEPWRQACYRVYGDRIFRQARLAEYYRQAQATKESIAKINRARARAMKERL